jgi:endonuclease/exonuclease/phosphatase family metal-dependent hydrolase
MTQRIRFLTYNIHKCCGLDRRERPDRIVEVLREVNADVIALQEVLSIPGDRDRDQAEFIATELGFRSCFGENRRLNGGAYGNLLLSRFPLSAIQNHDITTRRREQRGCLRADIELPGTTLHVFNVHMGTSFLNGVSRPERWSAQRSCAIPHYMASAWCWAILMSGPMDSHRDC